MKKWLRFLLLGLAAYVVFLVVTFPAAYAYRLIEDRLEGTVRLGGIDGTVWSGSAQALKTDGLYLENIAWSIRFWPLLLGRLELELDSADKALKFSGYTGRTLGGTVYIRKLQGQTPVATLQAMTPYPVPALQGQLIFGDLEIALSDGRLVKGAGNLLWEGATITVGSPLELGGFALELTTQDQDITGVLKDTGGPLQAEGTVKLTPEGSYQLKGKLTPRDGNGPLAQRLRMMLGAPGPAGDYEVNHTGQLPAPLF